MNVKLLTQVKEHILAEPERLNMRYLHVSCGIWLAPGAIEWNVCDTAHCFAGWGAVITGDPSVDGAKRGREVFGLTKAQGDALFFEGMWPREFFNRYVKARTKQEQAQVAADRIDHMIQYGL